MIKCFSAYLKKHQEFPKLTKNYQNKWDEQLKIYEYKKQVLFLGIQTQNNSFLLFFLLQNKGFQQINQIF